MSERLEKPGAIGVNSSNTWVYPSTRGAELVELPKFGGSRGEIESVQVQFVGQHIANRVEQAFGHIRGLEYKDKADPAKVLAHYTGAVRGTQILDEASLDKMSHLARGMATASDRERFFKDSVRTFLLDLTVKGR